MDVGAWVDDEVNPADTEKISGGRFDLTLEFDRILGLDVDRLGDNSACGREEARDFDEVAEPDVISIRPETTSPNDVRPLVQDYVLLSLVDSDRELNDMIKGVLGDGENRTPEVNVFTSPFLKACEQGIAARGQKDQGQDDGKALFGPHHILKQEHISCRSLAPETRPGVYRSPRPGCEDSPEVPYGHKSISEP